MNKENFLQIGQTTACGHCVPEKYGKGLKEAEAAIPDYQCDCKCHQENYKSHSHCWEQKQPPACGLKGEHKRCCLCDQEQLQGKEL